MLDRFAAKGLDVAKERKQAAALRKRQEAPAWRKDPIWPRSGRRSSRPALAKRRLFFREPELAPIRKILFVKRHAYEPSHNYSVLLDAPWRPGGGVCVLEIPGATGASSRPRRALDRAVRLRRRHRPRRGRLVRREPDLLRLPARRESGYFHLMSMAADGRGVKQLTDGPFHDFFPCPLPDGGLAFISTRCRLAVSLLAAAGVCAVPHGRRRQRTSSRCPTPT